MLSPPRIFLFLNVVLLLVSSLAGSIPVSVQLVIAVVLIGLIGIPHGAIDHVLFIDITKAKPSFFYTFYFVLIGVIISVWLFFPIIGMFLFLVLSAYHFGQSQFNGYSNLSRKVRLYLYLSWGISILSALSLYNHEEIFSICSTSKDLRPLLLVFQPSILLVVLIFSTLSFFTILFLNYKAFSKKKVVVELGIFVLIHLTFYAHSILIGFSIYFATLHSLKVLYEEYAFLKSKQAHFNVTSFLSILMPYTLISLIGIMLLFGLSHFGVIDTSKTLLIFIAISALTLPHSVVMENFYFTIHAKSYRG